MIVKKFVFRKRGKSEENEGVLFEMSWDDTLFWCLFTGIEKKKEDDGNRIKNSLIWELFWRRKLEEHKTFVNILSNTNEQIIGQIGKTIQRKQMKKKLENWLIHKFNRIEWKKKEQQTNKAMVEQMSHKYFFFLVQTNTVKRK